MKCLLKYAGFERAATVAFCLVFLAGLSAWAVEARIASPLPAIPRYAFDIELDYVGHRLHAVERVTLPNPSGMTLSELVFNVPPVHSAGVFYLHNVLVRDESIPVHPDSTLLTVTLPSELLSDEVVTLTLDFSLYIEPLGPEVESFAAANLGYTDDVLTVGYWYPVLAPYQPGLGWLSVPWHSVGDPFASESADYTATITATPGIEIVAGGEMTRQENVWHFNLPHGRMFAFIASDRYRQMDITLSGVTYSLYTFAEHAHLMPVTMQTIVRSAWLYNSLYGAYPYTSLRVAEVSGPWSMEFSGLVTLGFDEFANYNGTERNRLVRITAHEVSHQWWYSVVGNDQAREPWLDECLARFNELRYYEFYSPGDVGWWWNAVLSYAEPHRTVDSAAYDFRYHNSYIGVIYNRGAMFLDELRTQIGKAAFHDFLRDWYQFGSWRIATASDFFATLTRHTRADVRPAMWPFFAATALDSLRTFDSGGHSTPLQADVKPATKDRLEE